MNSKNKIFPSIASEFLLIEHLKIAYNDEGEGQVILCLHALGHSSCDFASIYNLPLTKYRIISVDFPGHGKSQPSDFPISATYYANIVNKFIKKLDLKDLIIIGNSIGGAVALRIASSNTNIKMLSLSNPSGLDKRGWLATIVLNNMINFFQNGTAKKSNFHLKFNKYYHKVLTSNEAQQRRNEIIKDVYNIAPLLLQGWKSFARPQEDLRPLIETIQCPVLFTWGINDKYIKLSRNKKAIQKFINYKLIKYNIGHTPYLECADLFLKDFQEYIEENSQITQQ